MAESDSNTEIARFGFRSFDRQYLIADARVISDPRPKIWGADGQKQIYLTALMAHSPSRGPALTVTALPRDKHHYKGSFSGSVFALWKNAAATESNISPAVIALLSKAFGGPVDPVDIFAYVAALLAYPAYPHRKPEKSCTSKNRDDLRITAEVPLDESTPYATGRHDIAMKLNNKTSGRAHGSFSIESD